MGKIADALNNRVEDLKARRKATKEEVAEALGIDKTTLSRWLRSESKSAWTAEHIERFADFLGISIAELLDPEATDRLRPELHRQLDEILLYGESDVQEAVTLSIRQAFQLSRLRRGLPRQSES